MEQSVDHHDKIFNILLSKDDEVTWQSIIYELVKSEEMNPWDVDVTIITQKYIDMLKSMKEHDFRVSGKVLLAAAILLKMKSTKLVGDDLSELDRLLVGVEEEMEDLEFDESGEIPKLDEIPSLIPRTPQPRKRKVSVFDLVKALERALEVKKRRVLQSIPPMSLEPPKKKKNVTEVIREVYGKISSFFYKTLKGKLTFSKLLPSESKEDKVYTFIPLLHLAQQNKIELMQNMPFGEIEVLMKNKQAQAEITEEES